MYPHMYLHLHVSYHFFALSSKPGQTKQHAPKGGRGEIDMLSETTVVGQEIQDNDIPYRTFQDIPIRIIPTNIN